MCRSGDCLPVLVKIPADLACTGKPYWKNAKIDRCIAPLVRAIQQGGIDMRSSCCGHGQHEGHIKLQDGRLLLIVDAESSDRYFSRRIGRSIFDELERLESENAELRC